jgi:hypothetical protein
MSDAEGLHRVGARLKRSMRSASSLATVIVAAAWVIAAVSARADEPMSPSSCAMRLALEVTPDVPDPTNGGFLSSLLGDHPGYQLFLLSRDDDTHVTLQLQGPGPAERCQAVVDSMRNDARVQSIETS